MHLHNWLGIGCVVNTQNGGTDATRKRVCFRAITGCLNLIGELLMNLHDFCRSNKGMLGDGTATDLGGGSMGGGLAWVCCWPPRSGGGIPEGRCRW